VLHIYIEVVPVFLLTQKKSEKFTTDIEIHLSLKSQKKKGKFLIWKKGLI